MAVTAKWFGNGVKNIANGNIIWKATGGSTVYCALLTSSWTPDQDANAAWSDISSYEVANGNGYATNGQAITLSDPTYDATTNETRLTAGSVTWANSTITARYAVIYKYTGTPSTSYLIGWQDFGQNESSSSGNFAITWATNGILKITAA